MSVQRRPTMYDVAALAGVSHQTVSRYLRADPTVGPDTSVRIKAAVDELGYRPNLMARAMRTRSTGAVAIILPGWTGPERTVAAACEEAQRLGYQVEIVIGVDEDPAALSRLADEILSRGQVDGVLSVTPLTVKPGGVVVQTAEFDHRLHAVEAGGGGRGDDGRDPVAARRPGASRLLPCGGAAGLEVGAAAEVRVSEGL
ncbi:LacI family DNA-binding transcriptional regulator [Kribbella sp. C-35]|uniref:LacI family DNA-binding transcriptional regulator n=1 Tax=Kribbella sp. C-35 TaxID=2789276 RepID=UPI00397D4B5A